MGAKDSKQSCISYEEAVKRISDAEFRRLKDAFRKSAGVGRLYLSRSAFQKDVLCEGVPSNISDLLYLAYGGTSKGISFKDLLCGIVMLTRGTQEEKTRFLWNLFCNDSGTYILKSDYAKTINVHTFEDVSLFTHCDRVNFNQFQEWIVKNENSTILSKWLLSNTGVNLTSELETPTFYQSLAGVTHLEEKDISDLEKEFWRLKNISPNGQLDLQLLGPLISPPIPKNALNGLFNAFDENHDGHIDFKELCCGVSAACRGPVVERTRFCFKIFDIDRDGVLNNEETKQMINVLIFVAKESRSVTTYKDLTKLQVVNDLLTFTDVKCKEQSNITLTAEDFMMWSVGSILKLVQPFLDLTFELCHIVFGLWPQCRHMEHDIVRGWLIREEKRHYRVGQFWYLISHDWWVAWLHYTQSVEKSCEFCQKTFSEHSSKLSGCVEEACVCDESYNTNSIDSASENIATDNCSLGSANSSVSSGRFNGSRPGSIDNTRLVTPNPFKSVRTLTGEGGQLKRDTPLVQNHDFVLIPKSLWNALNRWYGDNLPLPRQVIQPPNSADVELELYPVNIQILLHQSIPNNCSAISGGYGVMANAGGYCAISRSNTLLPPKRYFAYTAAFSRLATVRQMGEFLCEQLRLKIEDIRLWHITAAAFDNSAVLLEEENMSLKEVLIKDNDQVLLEIRNRDLTWPEELGSLSLNQSTSDRRLTRSSIMSIHAPGATGLHNLGNTCFMNAALQVLFNTQPLAQYFHRNIHFFELNTINKLGTHGQLAARYGELLKEVWTATTRSIAPLKLRFCITKHAPQFDGGGQHDSQELLEWFLDALHEDLNRVMEKPYSELKDSNGRPDKIVAAEAWAHHQTRNQSIVIDLFYGQLKSKVSCLCCGHESVRFDPFSLLSLPLPVENYVYFEIMVILLDGSVPVKYGLRLNFESKYKDLKCKLAELCCLNPNLMLVCEISNSQIRQIFPDEQKAKSSTSKELYVYQLPAIGCDRSRSSSTLGVNIEKGLKDIQRSTALSNGNDSLTSQTLCNDNQMQMAYNYIPSEVTLTEALHTLDVEQNLCASVTNKHIDEEGDCDDEKAATKQLPSTSRNPANILVNNEQKIVSSTKLLHCESNTYSSSSPNVHSEADSTVNYSKVSPGVIGIHNTKSVQDQDLRDCACRTKSVYTFDKLGGEKFLENTPGEHYRANDFIPKYEFIGEGSKHNSQSIDDIDESRIFSRIQSNQYTSGKYVIAVHRKITRQDSYFLSHHKTRPSLFGVPLLIPKVEGDTYKDLYCAVWVQVSRLLSPLPASTDQSNHAADCDDSLGYDFPFTLRAVKTDGLTCAICPWSSFCRGCEIPCNNDFSMQSTLKVGANASISFIPTMANKCVSSLKLEDKKQGDLSKTSINTLWKSCENFMIAIDWDPTALHLRYQSTLERLWIDHESITILRKEQFEPVDLNHCLRAFTSEEKLEQWYHCSHCKGKKPATKKLQVWKLPPILIVHLKRFNCANGKWVKSQKVVHFPFEDFDPTPYLASVPQETILRHRDLLDQQPEEIKIEAENKRTDNLCSSRKYDEIYQNSQNNGNSIDTIGKVEFLRTVNQINNLSNCIESSRTELDNCSNIIADDKSQVINADGLFNDNVSVCNKLKRRNEKLEKRKRLISTSLTKTPIVDGELEDFHQHKLNIGEDKFDLKYKLYAVVAHSGMLNGGHYISYAANQNGNWYCYNDSSCREISNLPNIDPSSAYMLFYERKGLDYEPYLPNIEGALPTSGLTSIVDDNDNDLKKVCVIA